MTAKDSVRTGLKNYFDNECRVYWLNQPGLGNDELDRKVIDGYIDHLEWIIVSFVESGLADADYVRKIQKLEHVKSCLWEAQLWEYLIKQEFSFSSKNSGPDFRLDYESKAIWIEAVTPKPMDIHEKIRSSCSRLISYPANKIPDDAFALRWTTAIESKKCKFCGYIDKGIVQDDDICIIAVSSIGMEKHHPFSFRQSSIEPVWALRVLYGIGNLAFDPLSNGYVRPQKENIEKEKDKSKPIPVPSDGFFRQSFKYVSAVLAAKTSSYANYPTEYVLIHNVNAMNKAPRGLFNVTEEWNAFCISAGEYNITRIDR